MASIGNLMINIGARIDGLQSGLGKAERLIGGVGDKMSGLGKIASTVGVALGALGAAAAAGVGAGLGFAASAGLGFNNSMEQVTAQLNAFTKDGAESARILEMIRQRAALTPFAFEEMAKATVSLMPAAKQSGTELEELVKLSEILAASNPAQGLEGAAFSLREALSGDFVSIVERFNLPRQRLNELKEQGVPALQAISQAMQDMGLDASLVANMSQTAAGRWSTLKDTFVTLAGKVTQPIFDTFSSGLGKINDWLTKNQDKIETFVGKLARISEIVAGGIGAAFAGDIAGVVQAGTQLGVPLETMQRLVEIFYTARDAALQFKDGVITALPEVWTVVQESLADMEPSFTRLKESFGKLGSAFADIGESMGLGESDNWLWMLEQVLNGIERQVKFIAGIMERISWAAQKTAEAIQIAIGLYNQISEITDWREKTGQFNYTGAGMPGVPGGAPATGASIPGAPGLVNLGQFADGGNFTVPGNGGGDQPFLIGLTPGEQVDVTPAGGGGQTSVSIPIQLDGQTIANYVLRLAGGRVVEMSRFGGTAAM